MGLYHVFKGSDSRYYWNLRANNGERILQSQAYTAKASALTGIASCKVNSPLDERYRRLTASDGLPYFTLHAANGEVIGASETYSTQQARETGIASCKVNGPTSPIQDDTGE